MFPNYALLLPPHRLQCCYVWEVFKNLFLDQVNWIN